MSADDSDGLLDRLRDRDGGRFDRRVVVLLLVVVLLPVGAGLGTVQFDFDGGGDAAPATPVPVTPTGGGEPAATPDEASPTETDEPAPTESAVSVETEATPVGGSATPSESGGTESESGGSAGSAPGGGGSAPGGGGGNAPGGGGSAPGDGGSAPTPEDGTDTSDPGVSLQAEGSVLSIGASGLTPGSSGREAATYRNAGDRTGRLSIANLTVEDRENGIVSAERPVDSSPDAGELSAAVHVELRIESGGTTTHLYGTEAGARPLAALGRAGDGGDAVGLAPDETATIVLTWHIPAETGNEIQSDAVYFDATISLTSTG